MRAESWRAYHLFYHGDRDRLLIDLVRPLVAALAASGQIDSFFFVRYALGGPHIRLRLRCMPGCATEVDARVRFEASEFFAHHPSLEPLDPATIRRKNRRILATSPHEREEDAVYPDNFVGAFPFEPEMERYGGPALVGLSLDFFALSSLGALELLVCHGRESRARQLPHLLRMLARQAWAFAGDMKELIELLDYPAAHGAQAAGVLSAEAERTFETSGETLCTLLRAEITGAAVPANVDPVSLGAQQACTLAAHSLSAQARAAGHAIWLRIGTSQMHMTANRAGLGNPEEIYCSQLLRKAALRLACADEPGEAASPRNESDIANLLRLALARSFSLESGAFEHASTRSLL